MKKYFLSMLSIMMVAVMSVSFISCGDDEPETPDIMFPLSSLKG